MSIHIHYQTSNVSDRFTPTPNRSSVCIRAAAPQKGKTSTCSSVRVHHRIIKIHPQQGEWKRGEERSRGGEKKPRSTSTVSNYSSGRTLSSPVLTQLTVGETIAPFRLFCKQRPSAAAAPVPWVGGPAHYLAGVGVGGGDCLLAPSVALESSSVHLKLPLRGQWRSHEAHDNTLTREQPLLVLFNPSARVLALYAYWVTRPVPSQ